jgi:hypothetical protein
MRYNTERSRKTDPVPVDVPAAISVLRQALGGSAVVEWPHEEEGHAEETITIRRAGAATRTQRLRLRAVAALGLPSPVLAAGADPVPTAWVLARSTAAHRDALRARGISFIDLGGTVHLALPWALVDRSDLTAAPIGRVHRVSADPFADKSSLILRVMMERELSRQWGVRELAGEANVGLATASDVVRSLSDRGLVSVARAGRALQTHMTDPRAVIEAWTHAYDWRMNRSLPVNAPVGDIERFLRRLPRIFGEGQRWALTLQAGASRVVPHATWDRAHVYVDLPSGQRKNGLAAVAARAGWQPASDGRLVLLVPHYRISTWRGVRTLDRLPVVSDVQLILDLWNYPVRGREQAEVLLRSRIAGHG